MVTKDVVLQLLENFTSSNPEIIQNSTNALSEINENPENFVIYCDLLDIETPPMIRQFSLNSIYRYLLRYKVQNFMNFIPTLKEKLVSIVVNDSNQSTKYFACDVISQIANYQQWIGLEATIEQLIHVQISCAFRILEKCYIILDNYEQITESLILLFSQNVNSTNEEIQLSAISFFISFVANIDEPEMINNPELFLLLFNALNLSIQQNKVNVVSALTKLICNFFDPHYQFFKNYKAQFVQYASESIINKAISSEMRVIIHQILESDLESDCIQDIISSVNNSISLSYEICCEERDTNQYRFNFTFLYGLTEIDSSVDCLKMFLGLVGNLINQQDICSVQVAIYVLFTIIPNFKNEIYSISDFLVNIITKGLNQSDFTLTCHINELIESIVTTNPHILIPIFDNLVLWYIHNIHNSANFFNGFILLILEFPQSTSKTDEIIQLSINLLKHTDPQIRGFSIQLICALLKHNTNFNQSLFTVFQYDSLLQDVEIRTDVVDLTSRMIKAFPLCIKERLNNIFDILSQSLCANDFKLNTAICNCISKLVNCFPQSCSSFLEVIDTIIKTISKCKLPEIFADDYSNMADMLMFLMANMFKQYNIYQDQIFDKVLESLEDNDFDEDSSNHVIQIISSKISNVDQLLNNNGISLTYKSQFRLLQNYFLKSHEAINSDTISNILSRIIGDIETHRLNKYLFSTLNEILAQVGNLPNFFAEFLNENFEESNYFFPNFILCLSYFSVYCNQTNIPNVINKILQHVNSPSPRIRTYMLRSLNFILYNNKNLISEINTNNLAQAIMENQFSQTKLRNESIAHFLITCNYNCEPSFAKHLFNIISFKKMSEAFYIFIDAYYSFYKLYPADFQSEFLVISTYIASSEAFVWNKFSNEIRDAIRQFLQNISPDKIIEILRNNESKIQKLQINMSM